MHPGEDRRAGIAVRRRTSFSPQARQRALSLIANKI